MNKIYFKEIAVTFTNTVFFVPESSPHANFKPNIGPVDEKFKFRFFNFELFEVMQFMLISQ